MVELGAQDGARAAQPREQLGGKEHPERRRHEGVRLRGAGLTGVTASWTPNSPDCW